MGRIFHEMQLLHFYMSIKLLYLSSNPLLYDLLEQEHKFLMIFLR